MSPSVLSVVSPVDLRGVFITLKVMNFCGVGVGAVTAAVADEVVVWCWCILSHSQV
jgi:hypothetical protein